MSKNRTTRTTVQPEPLKDDLAAMPAETVTEVPAEPVTLDKLTPEIVEDALLTTLEEMEAKFAGPSRAEVLKGTIDSWPESDIATRLRHCANLLQAFDLLTVNEVVSIKAKIDEDLAD